MNELHSTSKTEILSVVNFNCFNLTESKPETKEQEDIRVLMRIIEQYQNSDFMKKIQQEFESYGERLLEKESKYQKSKKKIQVLVLIFLLNFSLYLLSRLLNELIWKLTFKKAAENNLLKDQINKLHQNQAIKKSQSVELMMELDEMDRKSDAIIENQKTTIEFLEAEKKKINKILRELTETLNNKEV
jgi:hypothetical protein